MKCTKIDKIQALFFIVFFSIFIVRCTPEKQFKTLSFFFDGVPDPDKKTEVAAASSDTIIAVSKSIEPEFYVHKPYEENKCESCHEKGFSNALIKPTPDLCYTCHDDFKTKFNVLHGPVSSGYCTACHNQHMAKNKYLLMRTGQQVCYYCHESKQVLQNKMHDSIADKNCTECHSPHGGENRAMLAAGSCYNCHEDFSKKYNFLHGPAASGYCTSCHDSHTSKSKKHLLRESQQLCLHCHDAEQVFKNEVHKKVKTNECTQCHNPHGGNDRYILLKSITPGKE